MSKKSCSDYFSIKKKKPDEVAKKEQNELTRKADNTFMKYDRKRRNGK